MSGSAQTLPTSYGSAPLGTATGDHGTSSAVSGVMKSMLPE